MNKRSTVLLTRLLSLVLSVVLLLALTGCAAESGSKKGGGPVVAAVSKSIGELWLLAGGELAGITDDGMELEGITENTVSIGTISKPGTEAVLALEPDLVLLTTSIPAQKELKTELDKAGIEVMDISVESFADYDAVMKELTGRTGREDLYEKNVTQVAGRIEAVLESSRQIIEANAAEGKTYLAMRVSATKNKALKNDYFACEIFNAFGLTNAAGDNSALDELNIEAIIAADPDCIFIIPQGKESEAAQAYDEAFASNPVWSSLSAVKNGKVYNMPKDLFQYKPNALWDTAYKYAAEILG